jgi:hypothetical protein
VHAIKAAPVRKSGLKWGMCACRASIERTKGVKNPGVAPLVEWGVGKETPQLLLSMAGRGRFMDAVLLQCSRGFGDSADGRLIGDGPS